MRLYPRLAAVVAIAGAPAFAQNASVLDKLREINVAAPAPSEADLRSAITSDIARRAAASGACAPSAVRIEAAAPATGDRMVLQATVQGQIRNGWTVYAAPEGCPNAEIQRYLVLQLPDGKLRPLPVNAGRTYASPTIMRDTSASAAMAAFAKIKQADQACVGDDMKMLSARISGQSADLGPDVFGSRYTGSWSEIWQFETCGRRADVPVEFRPDGDGGAYTNVRGAEVALLEPGSG